MKTVKSFGSYNYDQPFADRLLAAFNNSKSDKGSFHCYHEVYSHLFFGRDVSSFLEIGLFLVDYDARTDLHAWAEMYPAAKIYGADRKKDLLFNTEQISTFYVDQDSKETLDELKNSIDGKVDVILDDASHTFGRSITTFESLYEIVADGGMYIIEDILIEKSEDGWRKHAQTMEEFNQYFSKFGHNYEMFSTSAMADSFDSAVVAIYKS